MWVVFVVGAIALAIAAIAVIVIAPSRRVRDEPPLPMPTQLEILLRGRSLIDDEIAADSPWRIPTEPATRTEDPAWQFDTAELTSLGNLAGAGDDNPEIGDLDEERGPDA